MFPIFRWISEAGEVGFGIWPFLHPLQRFAQGELYIDDGHTFNFDKQKQFIHRRLSFANNALSSRSVRIFLSPNCLFIITLLAFCLTQISLSFPAETWPLVPSLSLPPGLRRLSYWGPVNPARPLWRLLVSSSSVLLILWISVPNEVVSKSLCVWMFPVFTPK